MTPALGIVGAGAFGTALADVVASRGTAVTLWGDDDEAIESLRRTRVNEKRLPGVKIADGVRVTDSLEELCRDARLLLLAVPSIRVEEVAVRLGDVVDGRHMIVHAVGGPAADPKADALRRVSELLREVTPVKRVGVLAGPALARNLADRWPCAVVVASAFDEVIAATRTVLGVPPVLRVYGGRDVLGVELASALSGAITVAVGLSDGMGIGAGPRAVLICRGVAEAGRLLATAGASERTFGGLAGLGNLLVRTSADVGERSGDYQLGVALARGLPSRKETEGTRAARSGARMGQKLGVRTPILDAVVAVTYEGVPAAKAAARLLETTTPGMEDE